MSRDYNEMMRSRFKPNSTRRRRLRLRVYERDEFKCWICGDQVSLLAPPRSPWAATLDHIVPFSQGGRWSMDNLRTAHRACNEARGTG